MQALRDTSPLTVTRIIHSRADHPPFAAQSMISAGTLSLAIPSSLRTMGCQEDAVTRVPKVELPITTETDEQSWGMNL